MNKYYSIVNHSDSISFITISSKEPETSEFHEYSLVLAKAFAQTHPYVIVIDINEAKYLTAEQRIKLGKIVKENTPAIRSNCKGFAVINKSAIAKIILNGIFLVSPLPATTKTFSEASEAIKWGEEQIGKGIPHLAQH